MWANMARGWWGRALRPSYPLSSLSYPLLAHTPAVGTTVPCSSTFQQEAGVRTCVGQSTT